VPTVFWLATLVEDRRAGLVAALLTAVSPMTLQYAQQARAYMPAMLALTFAAIAVLKAVRSRSRGWALAGAVACAVALSLHYVSLAVVAPLCVWMLLQRDAELRTRLIFCSLPALVWAAWLPLALRQREHHPDSQLGDYGTFTPGHLTRVVAAPFDDRYTTQVGLLKLAAAAAVVAAVVLVALRSRERRELQLLLGIVVFSILALCVGALAGFEILNSRYMTFAAPFMLVILGSAIAHLRPPVALALLGVLLLTAAVYTIGSHRREGFYPDTRGVIAAIDSAWRPGDVVLEQTTLGVQFPLLYYAERGLPAGTRVVPLTDPAAAPLLDDGSRVWVVREEKLAPASDAAPPPGFRRVSMRRFEASAELTLELARR
jgi:uncharacterized membrane protein